MLSNQLRNGGLFVAIAAALCGIAGCADVQGKEEHVEHHIPEHKPRSYAAATEQVRQRHQKIVEGFQTAEINSLSHDLSELTEIIGWLPELAADSPMKKPAWDRVQAAAREMAEIYKDAATGINVTPRRAWPGDNERCDALVELLERQIPPSDDV